MAGIHSFPASQKLKSRKVIGQLFESGKHTKAYPIKVIYAVSEYDLKFHAAYVQMGISVPKRSFKSAVDRNRIKRQVREAYRMQHQALLSTARDCNIHLAMMMIYIDRKEPDFKYLEKKIQKLLVQLKDVLQSQES